MIDPIQLEILAHTYILECMNHKREQVTASGKVVLILDRHIPTIDYFLRIWIPLQGNKTIVRQTYYNWLNNCNDVAKMDTIKNIEGLFVALATDIVANEGKGIFYAKNRLGMTDRQQIDSKKDEVREIIITYKNNDPAPLKIEHDDD